MISKPNRSFTPKEDFKFSEGERVQALEKLERLREIIAQLGEGVVAFSGGCDSSFLLAVALEVLGEKRVVALTAVSPSLPERELEEAKLLARQLRVEHIIAESGEIEDPNYRENSPQRCFFCKDALFKLALREARKRGFKIIMYGSNLDDRGDYRPGRKAAELHGVYSPLEEAELTKREIRYLSKLLGLPTWNKPAMPCLASRFPYGTEITIEKLKKIERCEEKLRELGFKNFRARYHYPILRIELPPDEFSKITAPSVREAIIQTAKEQGFLYVTLDLEGYRQGSLNRALDHH